MVDWDDWRIFLSVAREHSLAGTARRLKVNQSTIGRRLAALQATAGTRLFDRTSDGHVLTAAGEAILADVAQIESRALAVERVLLGQDERCEGRVRLATSDTFASWFLVPRLGPLRQRQPGIVIELVTGNRPLDLARREADISLRLGKPTQPQLIARKLGRAAWALYASPDYLARRGRPPPAGQLRGHDVIGFDDELGSSAGATWLRTHARQATIVMTTNSLAAQTAAVKASLGVSALPCLIGDVEPGLRRIASGLVGHHDIWMVVHPDVRTSARVRAVMAALADLIKGEAPLLAGKKSARAPRVVG
jgi:DNA-binding transcriptional LysR family regulator